MSSDDISEGTSLSPTISGPSEPNFEKKNKQTSDELPPLTEITIEDGGFLGKKLDVPSIVPRRAFSTLSQEIATLGDQTEPPGPAAQRSRDLGKILEPSEEEGVVLRPSPSSDEKETRFIKPHYDRESALNNIIRWPPPEGRTKKKKRSYKRRKSTRHR